MSYSFRSVTRTARSLALLAAVVGVTGAIPRTASADAVITAGADKKVKIWNAADGALIKSIDAPDGVVSVMALSPNGKVLATGGADKKVKLWNAEDGSLIKSIDAHEGAVTSLAFNADGKKLISGGADKKVFIWDAADGKKLSTIGGIEAAIVNIFSLAEMTITGAADGKVKIVDGEGNQVFEIPTDHPGGLKCMSGNPAMQCLYTTGNEGKIKYFSQGGSGEFEGSAGSEIKAMAVLGAEGKVLLTGSADGKVRVWNAEDHKLTKTIDDAHAGGVTALAVSPDGKMIFTGGADKKVKVWSADGKMLKSVDAHEGAITAILYRKDKPKEEEKKKE